MYKKVIIFFLLVAPLTGHSKEVISESQNVEKYSNGDTRQLVSMPVQARALTHKDMLDHLAALNEIIGYLASNKLTGAADVAENRMGRNSMSKHRSTGIGPGKYMPLEMRNLGWGMHDAATEFSEIAKKGDFKATYGTLQKVTSTYIACHYNYRTL